MAAKHQTVWVALWHYSPTFLPPNNIINCEVFAGIGCLRFDKDFTSTINKIILVVIIGKYPLAFDSTYDDMMQSTGACFFAKDRLNIYVFSEAPQYGSMRTLCGMQALYLNICNNVTYNDSMSLRPHPLSQWNTPCP